MQSHFFSHSQLGNGLPTGYSAANVACLPWKCLSTLLFLLFDNFSLQSKHAGNPSALAMKANYSVQELFNPLFSSAIFLFFPLGSMAHDTPAGLFETVTCLALRQTERNVCRRLWRKSLLPERSKSRQTKQTEQYSNISVIIIKNKNNHNNSYFLKSSREPIGRR